MDQPASSTASEIGEFARQLIHDEARALDAMAEALGEDFERAVRLILDMDAAQWPRLMREGQMILRDGHDHGNGGQGSTVHIRKLGPSAPGCRR